LDNQRLINGISLIKKRTDYINGLIEIIIKLMYISVMQKYTCYLLLLALLSCNHYTKQKISPFNPNYVDSIGAFKERVIRFGDTVAYNKLSLYYTFNLTPWPLLYYSQIMCNKYKYPFACFDCYLIDCEKTNPENFQSNDSSTYIFGIYYLLKAKEMGYLDAKEEFNKVYGKQKLPLSTEYLKSYIR